MSTPALVVSMLLAAGPLPRVDFDTEVMPVFTKSGCNVGSCHGAAIGRGGFKLSLLGSNPEADHHAIVYELEGRRVNLRDPEKSLLLIKPTEQLEHGGGYRLELDGAGYERLKAWLANGAQRSVSRQIDRLQVQWSGRQVLQPGAKVALRATAAFDDGAVVDVTPWAVFAADDPAAVEIDENAVAAIRRRGQHTVIVRYLDKVVAAILVVPIGTKPVDLSSAARKNFIDAEILDKLDALRMPVAPIADDWTFMRRATLTLTGTLPSPASVLEFVHSNDGDKRERLIDRLLESSAFVDYWSLKWAVLLRIQSRGLGAEGVEAFRVWIREQLTKNTGLNEIAHRLLIATGDARKVGPANYSRVPGNARDHAEYVSQVFMGARLRCANCHDHPFDRWTQDDYHGLAAIFARLERGQIVKVGQRGEVIHPRTGDAAVPRLPGTRFLDADSDQRATFTDWLLDGENPYFARAAVNRLWKEMMGRGLVEPIDDMRQTNPPSHPQLLDRLADDFTRHNYNVRRTIRLIASSAAFQRSAKTVDANTDDERFYSHALPRPLEAEVLADALADVTGVPDRFPDRPAGTRAVQLFDSQVKAPSLDILGRCTRTSGPCEDETASAGGLSTTLHLINGPLINAKIRSPKGRLARLLSEGKSTDGVIRELYLRALSRVPSEKEQAFWDQAITDAGSDPDHRRAFFEDFLWSLLNSREFLTNH